VTFDVILLALATTVRPTSLAAVYTLLSDDEPRRLMIAYVIAGLAFTIAFGLLVTLAFHGVSINHGTDEAKGIAEIVGGAVVLGFAGFVLRGRVGGPRAGDAPRAPGRWERVLEGRRTVKTAALAGPLTHIPGLFYLVALNIIVAHNPSATVGAGEILLYNLIWFALPIAALATCLVRPSTARDAIARVNEWTRHHTRGILVGVSLFVGVVLLVRGVLTV
jgi:Sap, sulfolipid-1-addressing protein